MANNCGKCGQPCYRTRFIGGEFLGIDCGCLQERRAQSAVVAFGELTLDHIHDERGHKVRVTSLRQLQEAEKRYNFASVVANYDARNVDTPPQQKVFGVSDVYKTKFIGKRI